MLFPTWSGSTVNVPSAAIVMGPWFELGPGAKCALFSCSTRVMSTGVPKPKSRNFRVIVRIFPSSNVVVASGLLVALSKT